MRTVSFSGLACAIQNDAQERTYPHTQSVCFTMMVMFNSSATLSMTTHHVLAPADQPALLSAALMFTMVATLTQLAYIAKCTSIARVCRHR